MEDMTRRAALGLAAAGAAALATVGTVEAKALDGIPKSYGKVVAAGRGETDLTMVFEAEDGTLTVVNVRYFMGQGPIVLGEYKRT